VANDLQRATGLVDADAQDASRLNRVLQLTGARRALAPNRSRAHVPAPGAHGLPGTRAACPARRAPWCAAEQPCHVMFPRSAQVACYHNRLLAEGHIARAAARAQAWQIRCMRRHHEEGLGLLKGKVSD